MDSILGEFHQCHADDGEWHELKTWLRTLNVHVTDINLSATTGLVKLEHLYQRDKIPHQQLTLQSLIDHTRQRTILIYVESPRYC